MPYTGGVVGRMGARGSKNSVAVQQAIDAGMIVIGSSNISEGCMFHESNNLVYGQTNNPYDFSRSPGGSSGGCAAICASGAVPLVICSDVVEVSVSPAFSVACLDINQVGVWCRTSTRILLQERKA